MIVIDVDHVVNDNTALIVLENTGVYYTAQCGGIGCSHPRAEGFVLQIGEFAQDFDDCSYGCSYLNLPSYKGQREKLANDFDLYCQEQTRSWRWKIRFDFDRLDEIQEGWLPVIINGVLDEFEGTKFNNQKAIIHNGNCD